MAKTKKERIEEILESYYRNRMELDRIHREGESWQSKASFIETRIAVQIDFIAKHWTDRGVK